MDNNINAYFDFVLLEAEADLIEAEIEEFKKLTETAGGYFNKKQRNKIERKATRILNKLQGSAARSRAEADKRKDNIENIQDPEIKEIVKLKYIKGLTLEEIADILYCDRTTISRKIKRYCKRYIEKG